MKLYQWRQLRVGLITAGLLLAALGSAWAAEPWNDEPLSVPALRAAVSAAQEQVRTAADKPADVAEQWKIQAQSRIGFLEHLISDQELTAQLALEAKNTADAAKAIAELNALTSQTETPITDVKSAEDLKPFEQAMSTADAKVKVAEESLKRAQGERTALSAKGRDALSEEIETLKTRAEALKTAEATPLQQYEQETLLLQARMLSEELKLLGAPESAWSAFTDALRAQLELAKAQATRRKARFQKASNAVANALDKKAKEAAKEAAAKEAEAAAAKDPVTRFVKKMEAELAQIASKDTQTEQLANEVKSRKETSETALIALRSTRSQLEKRLALRGGTSGKIADLLRNTLERLSKRRDLLRRSLLPWAYSAMERVQSARAETQDRLLEIELPSEENPVYQGLQDSLGDQREARADEASNAFDQKMVTLRDALRKRLSQLETLEVSINALESGDHGYVAQRREIDDATAFVMGRIYWVRTDAPIEGSTFSGAVKELGQAASYYTADGRWTGIRAAATRQPWLLGGLLAAMALGIAVVFSLRRKRLGFLVRWLNQGGQTTAAIKHTLATLVRAAFAPALVLLGAVIVRVINPDSDDLSPLARGMELFALTWFAWRFIRGFLRPEGVAIKRFEMSAPLAVQLRESARDIALAVLLFYLPREVLRSPPLELVSVPRLLYTGFLALAFFGLWKLLPRGRPLGKLWVGTTGFWHGIWGLLTPLVALALIGIVAMDILGYRIGSGALTSNLLQTMSAGLILSALYFLLKRVVHSMATRVLETEQAEQGQKQARKTSAAVLNQMTRLVSVGVLVSAVFLLAHFWEVDVALRNTMSGIELIDTGADGPVTMWNVLVALVVVMLAHFVVRNLSGALEFVVFPLLGTTDAGSRYVWATLSRYAILVGAWSVAFVALKFSFSSIGWLLAAASVGLGFGLQEIVANFVSGLILLVERPVRVGDTITVGDTWGTVERINARATQVVNADRQMVIVPNKNFITQEVTNWTRNDNVMRIRLPVGVAYGSDIAKVLEILRDVTLKHAGVRKKPAPQVLFVEFGDSSLNFEVLFFCEVHDRLKIRSELHTGIDKSFRESGVEIPFPQRDLHIRSGLPGMDGDDDEAGTTPQD